MPDSTLAMGKLTSAEKKLLKLVRENPFVAQHDLADRLGIARSTVAAQLTDLVNRGYLLGRGYIFPESHGVVCIGGAAVNRKYYSKDTIIPATSNPSSSHRNFGGVARNVAENLTRLDVKVKLISLVGDDEPGRSLLRYMSEFGVDVSQTVTSGKLATAEYVAVVDETGDLHVAMAAMDAFEHITPELLDRAWSHIASSIWVFADCNLSGNTMAHLMERRRGSPFSLAIDTVSIPKASRLSRDLTGIDVLFTNTDEAKTVLDSKSNVPVELCRILMERGAGSVILTLGPEGHLVGSETGILHVSGFNLSPRDVNGAGDALMSGTIHGLLNGQSLEEASISGALIAGLTVESEFDVLPSLSSELLRANRSRLNELQSRRVD